MKTKSYFQNLHTALKDIPKLEINLLVKWVKSFQTNFVIVIKHSRNTEVGQLCIGPQKYLKSGLRFVKDSDDFHTERQLFSRGVALQL